MTELDALKGPTADAAQLWLDEARARVAVEQAINDASLKAIAGLGTLAGAPGEAGKTDAAP